MICAPAISTVAKRERRIVPPSPPTPPTTNSPPDHFGIGEGSLVPFTLWGGSPKQPARSLIVCVPQTRRGCPLREPLPSSRGAPGCAPSSPQRARTAHRARAEAARAGPALSPRPQRALLCSSASAIDSPLPRSGRWQRSPENGRGRGGPGDPRPRGPEAFTPGPARLLLARERALLPSFSVLCLPDFCLSVGTDRCLSIIPSLWFCSCSSSFLLLSGALSISLSQAGSQPLAPWGPRSLPPSQLTTAGSTPALSEAAWPGPLLPGACGVQESPCRRPHNGPDLEGGVSPWPLGEGAALPQPWGQ